ncbi:MAG: cation diffusion facilitator family transporter [Actinomycetota bacterium]|jgi:cobalt-zinc-cadmium efflux system protein|nr:cation diffusion facilitator family transporter [Actinomycetota bacterium]MDA8278989.1 cation diffusion facilitator family transporter [Actinomycetota bacterium]
MVLYVVAEPPSGDRAAVTRAARLWVVLTANLSLVGALVAVGVTAHSVGVWAEGVDYLGDAAAIGVALLALQLEVPTPRRPHGWPDASRLAALVNAGWLLVLTLLVAGGAIDRLVTGVHHVHGLPVLVVSGVAAIVMAAGAVVLRGDLGGDADDNGELSVRAVLLDTAADAAAAAGVAVAGGVIVATGSFTWLDPTVALVISLVVGFHALRLLARLRADDERA